MRRMDGIGGCRKRRRCRCGPISRCFFIAALWMVAIDTDSAAAVAAAAAEGTNEAAADEAKTSSPAIRRPTIVETGIWLLRIRHPVSPPPPTTAEATEPMWVAAPSGLPPCHPHHVQPPNWIGHRNTYIDITESGCSLILGAPIANENETAAHRPPLTVFGLYDGRHPYPTRHQLRAASRRRCSASVSQLRSPQSASNNDPPPPSPHPELEPPSLVQVMDAADRRGNRGRLSHTRLGGGRPVVRSFRVRNGTQPQFHVWTSSAVRIELQGACESVDHAPYFRRVGSGGVLGSLRLSVSNYPKTQSICQERDEVKATVATTTRQPLATDALFANDRRFQYLLPERMRCRGRVDYAANVQASHIVVQSAPHPASCRRLCVADRCGAELHGFRLTGEQADGRWVNVRYENLQRSNAAHHSIKTTTSAATDLWPDHDEDDDEGESHEDNEDPDVDDDVDVIGNSDVWTGGHATQTVASACRKDVYSGFVLLLSPGGRADLLP